MTFGFQFGTRFPRGWATLPDNVWRMISNALVRDLLGIPRLRLEAQRFGIAVGAP